MAPHRPPRIALALAITLAAVGARGCGGTPRGGVEATAPVATPPETATPEESPSDIVPAPGQPLRTRAQLDQLIERLGSERHADPERVIRDCKLEAGMSVADIGCGIGYFTFRLADAVGETGSVVALDIDRYLLDVLRADIDRRGSPLYRAIDVRLTDQRDAGLAAASIDVAFMAHLDFMAMEMLSPRGEAFMQTVIRALRPGGRLVVLQWMGVDPPFSSHEHVTDNAIGLGLTPIDTVHYEATNSYLQTFGRAEP